MDSALKKFAVSGGFGDPERLLIILCKQQEKWRCYKLGKTHTDISYNLVLLFHSSRAIHVSISNMVVTHNLSVLYIY